MPTNPNMVAIQTVTVGAGGAASIEFTNIPQTYTDLKIVCSARADDNGVADGFGIIAFNATTTGFSSKLLQGSGTAVTSASPTYRNSIVVGAGATANTFSNVEFYIPNYTSSNNKSYSVESVTENNGTESYVSFAAGLWSNSAAITSIKLADDTKTIFQYSTATLYGVTSAGYGAKATGGIITQDNNYFYHTFLSSGTLTPTQAISNVDYLVVAGGASGGTNVGGGGGAGGLRSTVTNTGGGGVLESKISLSSATNYTITVGAGGAGQTTFGGSGNSGSNSSIAGSGLTTVTSTGGGFGNSGGGTAGTGGSGGGGSGDGGTGGAGTANQGYAGGSGKSGGNYVGAGGGGAGAVGVTPETNTSSAGNGGNGVQVAINGTLTYYAGGGGGVRDTSSGGGSSGGLGGGGNGQYGGTSPAGTVNTGGGGGGNHNGTGSGSGGSGIVIVRYAK
jgi:hypothetical protein